MTVKGLLTSCSFPAEYLSIMPSLAAFLDLLLSLVPHLLGNQYVGSPNKLSIYV